MTEPGHASPAAGRGLLLIAAAAVIGALLLSRGFDDGGVTVSAGPAVDESADESGDGTSGTTLGTIPEGRPRAEVPVFVANGTGIAGVAGAITEQLQTAGYSDSQPPGDGTPTDFDAIFYAEGWEAEALDAAGVLGLDASAVSLLPDTGPGFDVGLATVVVHAGPTLAATVG